MRETIGLTLNGEERQIAAPRSVAGLLTAFGLDGRMVVVERNGSIVRRTDYDREPIEDGDQVEIVQMMAGG